MYRHERGGHGTDFLKAEESSKNPLYDEVNDKRSWEEKACLIQVTDESWVKTSPQYKASMLKNYGCYIPAKYK